MGMTTTAILNYPLSPKMSPPKKLTLKYFILMTPEDQTILLADWDVKTLKLWNTSPHLSRWFPSLSNLTRQLPTATERKMSKDPLPLSFLREQDMIIVPVFPFQKQVYDLLSSDLFHDIDNLVVNQKIIPAELFQPNK
jgi:hypothetical protein